MADESRAAMRARPEAPAVVTLIIPATPEYVGTARMTILGVTSRMGFSYDQIEDIRLAVGEACTNAIERARRRDSGGLPDTVIAIRSQVEPARLVIEVEDLSGSPGQDFGAAAATEVGSPAADIDGMNSQELGALLMEILVDEVAVEPLPGGGTRVRLVKHMAEA